MDMLTLFFVELYVAAAAFAAALVALALLAVRRTRAIGALLLLSALLVLGLNRYMAAHPEHLPSGSGPSLPARAKEGRGDEGAHILVGEAAMRRTSLYACSPTHLPVWERIGIESLIESAPRAENGGRLTVEHDVLAIVAHPEGFFVSTAVVGTRTRDDSVSPSLWSLLEIAFAEDVPWILFDWAEAPHANLPVF